MKTAEALVMAAWGSVALKVVLEHGLNGTDVEDIRRRLTQEERVKIQRVQEFIRDGRGYRCDRAPIL